MKKLLTLGLFFCYVVQAQGNSNWTNLTPTGYFNRTEKLGILTAPASPGERVATTFSYNITNDSVAATAKKSISKVLHRMGTL